MLIVGAGPTGLVLALWLTRFGVRVRIIDKLAASGTTSRALAVQARTLEYYQQMGLAAAVVDRGHKVAALNLWVRRNRAAHVPIENLGEGLTPFPFPLIFPQDEHETLLIGRLRAAGVEIERPAELVGFDDLGGEVRATIRKDGALDSQSYAYIAGCDGARSRVREVLGSGFPGGTYDHLFYVADVEAAGPPMNGELHVDLDDADFLAIFPMSSSGRARLIGSVRDDAAKDHEHLRFEDVQGRAVQNLQVEIKRVNWFSTYRVHHRVADRFHSGRAFLLGDAGHIHSPVGAQGMNTGIGDAVNLSWKLAEVLRGRADDDLLDTYAVERMRFARRLVATTDRVFTFVSRTGPIANAMRTHVVPHLFPMIFRTGFARRFLFRTVSQIGIRYPQSPLSRGNAGRISGGDRLPWIGDNFDALRSFAWQVHVYGEAPANVREMCRDFKLPLHEFPWSDDARRAGAKRDAMYLIRPDGYVGLAVTPSS